jgi:transcriptional regulator with XRE-family HTH domain
MRRLLAELSATAQKEKITGARLRRVRPGPDTVYTRTVRRAIDDVGGIEQLAALLKVSTTEIESWLSGKTSPGNAHFLQMLDVVAKGPR